MSKTCPLGPGFGHFLILYDEIFLKYEFHLLSIIGRNFIKNIKIRCKFMKDTLK